MMRHQSAAEKKIEVLYLPVFKKPKIYLDLFVQIKSRYISANTRTPEQTNEQTSTLAHRTIILNRQRFKRRRSRSLE